MNKNQNIYSYIVKTKKKGFSFNYSLKMGRMYKFSNLGFKKNFNSIIFLEIIGLHDPLNPRILSLYYSCLLNQWLESLKPVEGQASVAFFGGVHFGKKAWLIYKERSVIHDRKVFLSPNF